MTVIPAPWIPAAGNETDFFCTFSWGGEVNAYMTTNPLSKNTSSFVEADNSNRRRFDLEHLRVLFQEPKDRSRKTCMEALLGS